MDNLVVPAILDRSPESVRLIVTRGKDFHEWTLEDLLSLLNTEIELLEKHREPLYTLFDISLRFREQRVVLVGDIEKAFYI